MGNRNDQKCAFKCSMVPWKEMRVGEHGVENLKVETIAEYLLLKTNFASFSVFTCQRGWITNWVLLFVDFFSYVCLALRRKWCFQMTLWDPGKILNRCQVLRGPTWDRLHMSATAKANMKLASKIISARHVMMTIEYTEVPAHSVLLPPIWKVLAHNPWLSNIAIKVWPAK